MSTALILDKKTWAANEFRDCPLGDKRRAERVIKMATEFCGEAHGVLPKTFKAWAALKAAYRLLGTPQVTPEGLQQPHLEHTQATCLERGTYLLIQDTTDLNFTRSAEMEGLGWTGNEAEHGFLVHSTLAARIENWSGEGIPTVNVLGLFGQEVWTRQHKAYKGKETRWERQQRERESQRWARPLFASGGAPSWAQWIYVADRESDIYEVLGGCLDQGTSFVIRACWPRKVDGMQGGLHCAARQAPVRGQVAVELRGRPGQPARTAHLTVRARAITICAPQRPGGKGPNLTFNLVAAMEENPPPGVKPLEWVLLTDLPANDLLACKKVLHIYENRWLIEEYHKALKTGVGVEDSQLESVQALRNLLAVLAIVAVRLLRLKLVGRSDPRQPLAPEEVDMEDVLLLEQKYGRPKEGWTCRQVLRHIARLGGFLARTGDGEPGWLTLWRGWNDFVLMMEGAHLQRSRQRCG
jgi:hypothetical protein